MTPEQWKKIDELLDAALDLPAERHSAFLDEACEGDEELRRELESLLAAHQKAGSFIETTPAKGLASALDFEKAQASSGSLVGHKLGHYQIAALLGAGGMGEVYRARDPRLDRNVAIKVLPQHLSSHPDAMARFEREAKAVAALSHPNILAVYDFGHQDGAAYLVMELLEGVTLRQRLKDSVINWREAVKIAAAIADGLAAAHAKGIIHRDIKPENIFLTTDGQIKVLDFGIARVKRAVASNAATLLSRKAHLMEETKPGSLMGTIGYMSPEQVRGETVEAPGDIFSLGCLLVEMLTGKRPFTRPSTPETLAAILRDDPPAIDTAQDVPLELEKMARRCLEKNPEERFQSARDLAVDLRSLLTSAPGAYRAVSGFQRAVTGEIKALPTGSQKLPRLRQWFFPTLAIALGAVLIVAVTSWWNSRDSFNPPPNSLAVLPLLNETNDKSIEFLSDGVSENITSNLSQLNQKLFVLGNSSVRSYKGREINSKQVGRELNVSAVFTGRVRQEKDTIIISVELVDTMSGRQLWGWPYTQPRANLDSIDSPMIQSDISTNIVEKLGINLTVPEKQLLARRHTENKEANNLYLQGRVFWNRRKDTDLEQAIKLYQQAIDRDDKFALAYAGMAEAYALIYDAGPKRDEARDKANYYARRAMELDNKLAAPHSTLGFLEVFRNQNWEQAEKYFSQAKDRDSSSETTYHWHAIMLAILGQFDKALAEIEQAQKFAPRSFPINKDRGEILYYARRFDEAIDQFRKTIEIEPKNPNVTDVHAWVRGSYERKNDLQSAINEYKIYSNSPNQVAELQRAFDQGQATGYWQKRLENRLRDSEPTTPNARMLLVFSYAAAGEVEKGMEMLERCFADGHDQTRYLKVDARFDGLRSHPRFAEFLKRLNLQN